jgi:hypothetical protein
MRAYITATGIAFGQFLRVSRNCVLRLNFGAVKEDAMPGMVGTQRRKTAINMAKPKIIAPTAARTRIGSA